jgi:hypothetical protein
MWLSKANLATSTRVPNERQLSTWQVRISVFQFCILITVPQLTLHASIAALFLRVLFRGALAPILIPRFHRECSLFSPNYATLNTVAR